MRHSLFGVLVLGLAVTAAGHAGTHLIDLDDIVEIRGYQPPPPDAHSTAARPAPVDLQGSALRGFLGRYVRVKNEDVVATAFSSASATAAVFRNEERGVTLMYAACPWDTASLVMIAGPPHMLVFVVDAEFVIFQLRDLCRRPPPGFTPRR